MNNLFMNEKYPILGRHPGMVYNWLQTLNKNEFLKIAMELHIELNTVPKTKLARFSETGRKSYSDKPRQQMANSMFYIAKHNGIMDEYTKVRNKAKVYGKLKNVSR